jgi:glycosyltransferase involved in cell wall biosynthesis
MANPDQLQYGLDRMIATGKRIFGWGWAADGAREVTAIHLLVRGEGWQRRLQADIGLARADVDESFPQLRNAASSGFIVTGYLPEAGARSYALEIDFHDGSRSEVAFDTSIAPSESKRRRQLGYLVRALWRRLKRGDIAGIVRRAKAQRYAPTALQDADLLDALTPLLRKSAAVWLVFDHNMGGGANQYRRELIEQRIAAGEAVVFCTYNLPMLEYRLHLHRPGAEERVFGISSFLALEPLFAEIPALRVFVNSPVSFDEPLMLAEWLGRMRAQHPRSRLVVTTHDYFAACPSFVLLDSAGRHCAVPATTDCAKCLPAHQASYVALSPPTQIGAWRASWGRCLAAADEVRCFSEASRQLLLRAHPALDPAGVSVVPHKVDFVPRRLPRVDACAPLTIGVVGEISPQKGAYIVNELLDIAERDKRDIRLVVVGTFEAPCRSPRITVTGRYRRADLPDLIEAHGINMFLFPSIWPETFSYVVAELMALHVPIVAFDLGAPAERLRSYALGRLCKEISSRAALDTLTAFHEERARADAAKVA